MLLAMAGKKANPERVQVSVSKRTHTVVLLPVEVYLVVSGL